MKWITDFYISDNIKIDRRIIKRRVNRCHKMLNHYLLAVSDVSDGMIDIIPVLELRFWPKWKLEKTVAVGVAKGKASAYDLVMCMCEDSYSATGTYDIRSFLLNREI